MSLLPRRRLEALDGYVTCLNTGCSVTASDLLLEQREGDDVVVVRGKGVVLVRNNDAEWRPHSANTIVLRTPARSVVYARRGDQVLCRVKLQGDFLQNATKLYRERTPEFELLQAIGYALRGSRPRLLRASVCGDVHDLGRSVVLRLCIGDDVEFEIVASPHCTDMGLDRMYCESRVAEHGSRLQPYMQLLPIGGIFDGVGRVASKLRTKVAKVLRLKPKKVRGAKAADGGAAAAASGPKTPSLAREATVAAAEGAGAAAADAATAAVLDKTINGSSSSSGGDGEPEAPVE